MKAKDDIFELCDVIRETSFALHQYLQVNFGAPKLQIRKYALSDRD